MRAQRPEVAKESGGASVWIADLPPIRDPDPLTLGGQRPGSVRARGDDQQWTPCMRFVTIEEGERRYLGSHAWFLAPLDDYPLRCPTCTQDALSAPRRAPAAFAGRPVGPVAIVLGQRVTLDELLAEVARCLNPNYTRPLEDNSAVSAPTSTDLVAAVTPEIYAPTVTPPAPAPTFRLEHPPSDTDRRTPPPSSASVAQKAAYVKAEPQTRGHHCHWPGCDKQVPPAKWGCPPHWFTLPKRLRDAIWDAYAPGQERTMSPSRTYVEVAREVQDWIAANHPPAGPAPAQGQRVARWAGERAEGDEQPAPRRPYDWTPQHQGEWREEITERAAIFEYLGGYTREQADRFALHLVGAWT